MLILSAWRLALVLALTVVGSAQTPDGAQPRQLRVNGADLTYVEQGTGTPILFVHGAVTDHRFWDPQRQDIARKYRFVAYSQRYHGTASWPDQGSAYTAATHAADLAAFIGELEAGPVHLVGLSYGGTIAAMVARDHPRLLRSLTLAEPGLFNLLADVPEGKPVLAAVGTTFTEVGQMIKAGEMMRALRRLIEWVDDRNESPFDRLPEPMRRMLEENARTLPLLLVAPPVLDLTCQSLGAITLPTLVVRGEQTPRQFSLTNERVLSCIAGSRSAVVPGAAHTMSYENPSAFTAAVLQFVGRYP